MKNNYEDMSIEELLGKISKIHKKKPPKKANINEGAIILDPNNENDWEWYENDEDYLCIVESGK
ncbi:hypothetical protein [Caldifermentibacillus hisashii]|uniref:hypothetical protein n=1 Tax=Caldifermentibacillus hisashii TaxID=996558 RepID=UPI0022B9CF3A|nr:hypothetical protein [Caldifermentibacillus hisashii]